MSPKRNACALQVAVVRAGLLFCSLRADRRDLAARGDLDAGGLAFSFNPFYFSNAVPLRLKYDVGDRDLQIDGEVEHRLSAALDLSLYPGLTFVGQGRGLFRQGSEPSADLFLHVHLWF